MATFFGEILPVYSRAVDDEDEDDDVQPDTSCSVLRWSPTVREEMLESPTHCLPCETLIIAIGPEATGFTQAYMLDRDAEIVCVICSGMEEGDANTFSQTAPTDKACYVYRIPSRPTVLICVCNSKVPPQAAYSWTEKLLTKLEKPSSPIEGEIKEMYVAVLTSMLASEYKSETPIGDLQLPFLRSLKTDEFPATPMCPYLEQPNVVPGLPAAIMSYCAMHCIRAVLYVCYAETIFLDSETMRKFKSILKATPIKDVLQANQNAEETLKKFVELYAPKNSLYI